MTNPLQSFGIKTLTGAYWYFRGTLPGSLKTKVAGSSQTTVTTFWTTMCHKPWHYNMKLCIMKTAILWQTKFQMGDTKFSWMWPKIPVIWDVLPGSLVPIYKHFGEISSISIFKVDKSIMKAAASGKQLSNIVTSHKTIIFTCQTIKMKIHHDSVSCPAFKTLCTYWKLHNV